ncbi:hypothetical protein K439DRAFT_1326090, partial [Ramaria rubella]
NCLKKNPMAIIGADSQAALQATWNHKCGSGKYIVDKVIEKIDEVKKTHKGILMEARWVSDHKGIEGNEEVDKEAKLVTSGQSSPNLALPRDC